MFNYLDPSASPDPGAGLDASTSGINPFLTMYAGGGSGAPASGAAGVGMPVAGAGSSLDTSGLTEYQKLLLMPIYLGTTPGKYVINADTDPRHLEDYHVASREHTTTIGALLQKFDAMSLSGSDDKTHDTARLLMIAGFWPRAVDPTKLDDEVKFATLDDTRAAYLQMLQTAADYAGAGLGITPNNLLRQRIAFQLNGMGVEWDGKLKDFNDGWSEFLKNAGATDALGGSGSGSSALTPGTYTSTSRSVDFMDPMDAKNLTRGMLQQELGRDPTQAEYEDFLSAINAAERHNPTTTTTTTTQALDKNGGLYNKSQSSTTHQGIGANGINQLLYQKAISQPDWAEWQAMGTYFPALLAALGSPVAPATGA